MLLVTGGALRLADTESAVVVVAASPERGPALIRRLVRIDPLLQLDGASVPVEAHRFDSVRRGLTVGLVLVMLLIGAVLLVSVIDQLRERRAALAALAAIGMRRRTMAASILWESAVPVGVGTIVATVAGFALGWVLLAAFSRPFTIDAPRSALAAVTALAVPMAVTALGLPGALRLMRPEGLRAE